MTTADALQRGRESFGRRAWADAFAELSAADREHPLEPDDLERLGIAAYLTGRDDESLALCERGHRELLARGDEPRAVRCAFWVAFNLLNRGDFARAGGWLARGRRILDEGRHDCVERGYLLVPPARMHMLQGEWDEAHALASEAAAIGERFGDRDLVALARMLLGRSLIARGMTADGLVLLDEAMVAVVAD